MSTLDILLIIGLKVTNKNSLKYGFVLSALALFCANPVLAVQEAPAEIDSLASQECEVTVNCADGHSSIFGSTAASPCTSGPTDFDSETCEYVCLSRDSTVDSCTVDKPGNDSECDELEEALNEFKNSVQQGIWDLAIFGYLATVLLDCSNGKNP